jgi:ATP-dependent DNA ligase
VSVREPPVQPQQPLGEGITAEEMKLLTWVKPQRVAEVSFAEWTRDGSLRHASFIGLRDDKRARDMRVSDTVAFLPRCLTPSLRATFAPPA